jgi:hypothetical protein
MSLAEQCHHKKFNRLALANNDALNVLDQWSYKLLNIFHQGIPRIKEF